MQQISIKKQRDCVDARWRNWWKNDEKSQKPILAKREEKNYGKSKIFTF